MTGLFGPNGAGKTTLVSVLTGFQPASSGEIFLGGVDVSRLKQHKLRRLGIARIFQGGRHRRSSPPQPCRWTAGT